jgi:Ulp1 family protease
MLSQIRAHLADIETLHIPVNFNDNHWLLFVMDFKLKRWLFYDSLTRVTGKKGRDLISKVRQQSAVLF